MFKDYTLLVIEDDTEFGILLQDILNEDFKKVYYAKNATEALNIYKALKPNIILSDINLPKMDGYELSKIILDDNPNQSIILMTAHINHYNKKAQNNIKCLVKPIQIESLYKNFEEILVS